MYAPMIYVHVPFCRSFCTYCDFYSEIATDGLVQKYTEAVCAEIRARAKEIDPTLPTLYFGGGTPSLLPIPALTKILLTLAECGHGGPWAEFTLEANPEDIVQKGVSYVKSLLALGVDRLSMGVQSFDDDLLRWMNRRHTADRAREAVRICREAGVENLSIDLIFGLSNLSDSVWEATVDEAIALGVDHISCYQLTVEGDNALTHMLETGDYTEATDEQCWRQYYTLCRKAAAAGFNHYEISNFAKPGFEAVHNGGYWQRRPYAGFGPAAHSFSGRSRGWNSSEIEGYTHTEEALSVEDEKIETLMLALRTSRGIDEEFLRSNCSSATIDSLLGERALVKEGRRYRIPEDHFFTSDEIIRELV